MILQTQKDKIIYVFFNKLSALLVLYRTITILVIGVKNTLCHENFNDVEEGGIAV